MSQGEAYRGEATVGRGNDQVGLDRERRPYEQAVTERMWPLTEFRFDEGIEADEVYLALDELEPMTLGQALAIAKERGTNVVA